MKDNESNLMKFTEYEKPIPIEYPSNGRVNIE